MLLLNTLAHLLIIIVVHVVLLRIAKPWYLVGYVVIPIKYIFSKGYWRMCAILVEARWAFNKV